MTGVGGKRGGGLEWFNKFLKYNFTYVLCILSCEQIEKNYRFIIE